MGFMRDDDGNGLLGVWRCVYADVGDEVTGLVDRLEAFEGDVLRNS